MYNWGYILNSTLSKLDLDEEEALTIGWLNKFIYFANEAMTQICSTVKPKRCYYSIQTYNNAKLLDGGVTVDGKFYANCTMSGTDVVNSDGLKILHKVGTLVKIDDANFVSFSDEIATIETYDYGTRFITTISSEDMEYKGHNQVLCKSLGTYLIPYNAKWFKFYDTISDDTLIDVPDDILDCIPSYIASQCYKVDDEYKSSVYRNEYEMFLARIDDTDFKSTFDIQIGGDW